MGVWKENTQAFAEFETFEQNALIWPNESYSRLILDCLDWSRLTKIADKPLDVKQYVKLSLILRKPMLWFDHL